MMISRFGGDTMDLAGKVFVSKFDGWHGSLDHLLDDIGLMNIIGNKSPVLIKPNLINSLPPPITTPVELVDELINYLRKRCPDLEIIIGEGCGSKDYDTFHPFRELGYIELAEKQGIRLVDLNNIESLRRMELPECRRWPEMFLPELVLDSFLLSVPVLKAHSMASVTLTMKNMLGCAPPTHYEKKGHWKKAAFHNDIQEAILDLNRYRTPDFTLLDATVGMQEAHLWGPSCNPPHRKLVAAVDPVAIDAYGAGLLGREWQQIGHIKGAHGVLGKASPLDIIASD